MAIFLTPEEELCLLELLEKAHNTGFLDKEVSARTCTKAERLRLVLAKKHNGRR